MPYGIQHATVIGSGTMGAAIAGHLANAGITVSLLDIVPGELTPQEQAAGLALTDRKVRNRIVQTGYDRMVKANPANLFVKSNAQLISVGNLEDDFDAAVGKSDWVIEVIVERPGPKQKLMERIEAVAGPKTIISTNTSGIPIHIISEGRTPGFKQRFLGTHFFNDLVEWDMLYLALFPGREGNQWSLEFFEQSPNRLADLVPEEAKWAHAVKVIDPAADQGRLTLWASSLEQKVFCYLAQEDQPNRAPAA